MLRELWQLPVPVSPLLAELKSLLPLRTQDTAQSSKLVEAAHASLRSAACSPMRGSIHAAPSLARRTGVGASLGHGLIRASFHVRQPEHRA